jgi:putative endonuclease
MLVLKHLGTGVRIPPPPFDSLRSLMAGHSLDTTVINERIVADENSESNALSVVEGHKTIMWYVYILQCSDESYYIGHANNLSERVNRHNSGRAAQWTACRLPVKLIYNEVFATEEQAVKRERQIKKWSRAKKQALITADKNTLKELSQRKTKNSF